MLSNFVVNIFTPQGFVGLIHFLFVFLEILYVVFSFILTREVSLMNNSLSTVFSKLFSVISFVNFILSIGLVTLSLTLV